VGTYVEVLRRRGADPEVVAGLCRELERIDSIVRSLLDYARPHGEVLDLVAPGDVLQGAFGLLQSQGALKGVEASLDVASDVPRIRARAHLLEQVLVNLMLNAVDAAPGGVVVLGARRWAYEPRRAAPRRTSDAPATLFSRVPSRRPARVEIAAGATGALLFVADAGRGVSPEDRERIFEPFFTTKAPGRGTGLGLAIVARAVDEMGGVVWVETAREGGAAFKLFFLEASG
jgi:signal transduction histidine kinase